MLDIYKSVYKLNHHPFRLRPDYRFSFGHQSYNDAKSYLKYAINEGEGFVAITGAPGTGKTTMIASLIAELDCSHIKVGVVTNLQMSSVNLLTMVSEALAIEKTPLAMAKDKDKVYTLLQYLIWQHEAGNRVILIVDEAQGLTAAILEELRMLSNFEHEQQLLLQIFLVGQEPLMDIIRSPGMEQLHQRLIATAKLKPLNFEQTAAYIVHRLRYAGWNGDPSLSKEVCRLVHKFSDGIPRVINLVCHRLFLHAGIKQKHKLSGSDALVVVTELYKEGLLSPVARKALVEYIKGMKRLATC